uniref:Elongator complex protein 5 n=1 Tax=Knipowitschia caucasica TaxID=637954 RepID=A0AAV2KPN0_KNICA
MLLELLQGSDSGGILLIKDRAHCSGRNLLKSFIKAALHKEEEVHVLLFEVSDQELKSGLKDITLQRLHIHNMHICTTYVCTTLHQLNKGGTVKTIMGLLHVDMHQKGTVGSVCHLATSLISLAPGNRSDSCVAKITKRTKSGKVLQEEQPFCINEDLSIIVLNKSSNMEQTVQEEHQIDPTVNLTFNLRLSDKEREAKEKLLLPYMFSKDKKTALLYSGSGSGRILYEPDANDDYDQEDPDDDLDF